MLRVNNKIVSILLSVAICIVSFTPHISVQ